MRCQHVDNAVPCLEEFKLEDAGGPAVALTESEVLIREIRPRSLALLLTTTFKLFPSTHTATDELPRLRSRRASSG